MNLKTNLLTVLVVLCTATTMAQQFQLPQQLDLADVAAKHDASITEVMQSDDEVVLVLFNPICGHCIDFLDSTRMHHDDFEGVQFVFVYGENPDLDANFDVLYQNMNLAAYDRFTFGTAAPSYFDQYRITALPSIYHYAEDSTHQYIQPIELIEHNYQAFIQNLEEK